MKLCALLAIILYYSHFNFWVKMDNFFNAPHHSSAVRDSCYSISRIHDIGLDASYMEANGNQNVDLNSQLGTIVATHPPLQLKQNSIPSPPPSLNFVVHPCLSFARFCESRISSNFWLQRSTRCVDKPHWFGMFCFC